MGIESMLVDRNDPAATLNALSGFRLPEDDRGLRLRVGILTADALAATGLADSARATLSALLEQFPGNQRIEAKMAELR